MPQFESRMRLSYLAWLRGTRMVAWVMCARHARNARRVRTWNPAASACQDSPVPTSLDNGRRSPRKILRTVVARLLGGALSSHARERGSRDQLFRRREEGGPAKALGVERDRAPLRIAPTGECYDRLQRRDWVVA